MKNIDDLVRDVQALERLNATLIVIYQSPHGRVFMVDVTGRTVRIGREALQADLDVLAEHTSVPHVEEQYERGLKLWAFPPTNLSITQFAKEYGRVRSQG